MDTEWVMDGDMVGSVVNDNRNYNQFKNIWST